MTVEMDPMGYMDGMDMTGTNGWPPAERASFRTASRKRSDLSYDTD